MEIIKTTVIRETAARGGVRVIFQHVDAEGNVHGPYVIHRPTTKGLTDVLADHARRLEARRDYTPDPEDEKLVLIEMLQQHDARVLQEVLGLSAQEVVALRESWERERTAKDAGREER